MDQKHVYAEGASKRYLRRTSRNKFFSGERSALLEIRMPPEPPKIEFDNWEKTQNFPLVVMCHILHNMESKIFLSNGCVFLTDVCRFSSRLKRRSHAFLNVIFCSLNCSTFATERDWIGKNSQNVRKNVFYFRRKMGFFEKKP